MASTTLMTGPSAQMKLKFLTKTQIMMICSDFWAIMKENDKWQLFIREACIRKN